MTYLLIFLGGLLGSSHCVGMCGGFAISIGAGSLRWQVNLQRQIIYSAGRVFTYVVAGAIVASAGMRLTRGSVPIAQSLLCLLAGALLVWQGLHATGLPGLRWRRRESSFACQAATLFRAFLTGPGLVNVFIAGVMTGFLPCGLAYAYLALAASSGGMPQGMLTMGLFGLGTIPLMILIGTGTTLLSLQFRTHVLRLAGWCVLLTGIMTCYRGGVTLPAAWNQQAGACPLCEPQGQNSPEAGTAVRVLSTR